MGDDGATAGSDDADVLFLKVLMNAFEVAV